MDYSGKLAMYIRSIGQELHVLPHILNAYRRLSANAYEHKFRKTLLSAIRPGDNVWDVGANVGLYAELFADLVGPDGKVIAFEPSPKAFAILKLKSLAAKRNNVFLQNVALSDADGLFDFFVNKEELSTSDGLMPASDRNEPIKVTVKRGDTFIHLASPSIIKIDVEGFELEVLNGMQQTMSSANLRAIFIEVHFLLLKKKGTPDAPSMIAKILHDNGFKVSWTDPSHIFASRKN
jgi:FkbM family methyltransferase